MFRFISHQFSEFAHLGDLSRFTLNEIKPLIKKCKREEKKEGDINYVTWYNASYSIEIEYDLDGKFIRINSEEWINPKMNFISTFRNYDN